MKNWAGGGRGEERLLCRVPTLSFGGSSHECLDPRP